MAVDRLLGRLASLISMGEKVLATRCALTGNVIGPDRVRDDLFRQWRTSSLAFLNTLLLNTFTAANLRRIVSIPSTMMLKRGWQSFVQRKRILRVVTFRK